MCRILTVVTALAAVAQTAAINRTITAVVAASKTGPPISPHVYGQLLEPAGSLISSSPGSEVLDGRKLYYHVTNRVTEEPNSAGRRAACDQRRQTCFGPSAKPWLKLQSKMSGLVCLVW